MIFVILFDLGWLSSVWSGSQQVTLSSGYADQVCTYQRRKWVVFYWGLLYVLDFLWNYRLFSFNFVVCIHYKKNFTYIYIHTHKYIYYNFMSREWQAFVPLMFLAMWFYIHIYIYLDFKLLTVRVCLNRSLIMEINLSRDTYVLLSFIDWGNCFDLCNDHILVCLCGREKKMTLESSLLLLLLLSVPLIVSVLLIVLFYSYFFH